MAAWWRCGLSKRRSCELRNIDIHPKHTKYCIRRDTRGRSRLGWARRSLQGRRCRRSRRRCRRHCNRRGRRGSRSRRGRCSRSRRNSRANRIILV